MENFKNYLVNNSDTSTAAFIPLLRWFEKNQRAMPWRQVKADPYQVWISEMMLQQTQVVTVIPYFHRFMERFPSIEVLATSNQQDLLKVWEGLGYYSRARNVHKAAKIIMSEWGGLIPSGYESLQGLPGIGPYAAAAIASIAFGEPVPVVDGNVLRVFTRYWGIKDDIRQSNVRRVIFDKLHPLIQHFNPSSFNQGIMELGALICNPKSPLCLSCPLQGTCVAYTQNRISEFPFKSKSVPTPHYHIAVGLIRKSDKLLIGRRKEEGMLGGLWEFPGGKQQGAETLEETVFREVREETNLEVCVLKKLSTVKHAYTHFKISLHAFYCYIVSGEEKALSADELRWVTINELDAFPFPKANLKIIKALREERPSVGIALTL